MTLRSEKNLKRLLLFIQIECVCVYIKESMGSFIVRLSINLKVSFFEVF